MNMNELAKIIARLKGRDNSGVPTYYAVTVAIGADQIVVNNLPDFESALTLMNALWYEARGKYETRVSYADRTHEYLVIRNAARPFDSE